MRKYFIALVFAAISLVASAQSEIKVQVPEVVALGEEFNITFIVEGGKINNFQWEPGEDFNILWGPQSGYSTSTQFINGKRSQSTQHTFTYILSANKAGEIRIPKAQGTYRHKGKEVEISSESITIEVIDQGDGGNQSNDPVQGGSGYNPEKGIGKDNLFLSLTFNKKSVVVGEPIEATLKLYHRVNIAGFEDVKFPDFNGFWSQETESPSNIEFKRETYNNKIYESAILRKYLLIPQQVGKLEINPAELVCLVNIQAKTSTGSIFDSFFNDNIRTIRQRISTGTNYIEVAALPDGAPSSFGGGVGDFTISAKVSKDTIKTHEAAALIITIKGKGNVSLLEAPKVPFPPDFDVYDVKTSEKTAKATGGTVGSKTFEYPFIPRSHGDFEIESIKYSFYDTATKKYKTLESGNIPVSIVKSKENASFGSVPEKAEPGRSAVKNLNHDIRYISTRLGKLHSVGDFFLWSNAFWAWFAGLILLGLICYLSFRKIAARRADVVGMKYRKATKLAMKKLQKAEVHLKARNYEMFYEELHKALLGFVADKLNMSAGELNKEEISEQMKNRGAETDSVERLTQLIDACEFARYSPQKSETAVKSHYDEAIDIISALEGMMKQKSHKARMAAGMIAFVAIMLTGSPLYAHQTNERNAVSPQDYIGGLWNKAVNNYEEGNWEESLKSFLKIEDAGLVSNELYTNIGNAYFKSGNLPYSILYYERALKMDPSDKDAAYNKEIATGMTQDRIDPVPEFILTVWTRNLCYIFDSDAWAYTFLIFLALTIACVLLFVLGNSLCKKIGFFTGIFTILAATIALSFSIWQRNERMEADSAILVSPVVSVKSAPTSESATNLFILHEGTKVEIIDEVGGWRNIQLADGRQGWIESSDMEII